jgi:pyruvate kinase
VRHTRIVATLGPASDSDAVLDELIAAGVDVVRLNFSHGTHDSHRAALGRVRAAGARAGRHVGVLQDLPGPKIRIGRLDGGRPIMLEAGRELLIETGDGTGHPGRVFTSFSGLAPNVRPGDRLLLDDGRIELQVRSSDARSIRTTVVFGGVLGEHKGINAPGVALPASALTARDVEDLRFGLSLGVDLVALSFVQEVDDLVAARSIMEESGHGGIPLIAKIERPRAAEHLPDLLAACDGIMIARGDLGLELPLEKVPGIQRRATELARARGVPVIVATQVLDSMRTEPRPTRAEVSDAANAVHDGVDAIMLAGETAIGVAPARVVRTLHAIIEDAEIGPPPPARVSHEDLGDVSSAEAIVVAAVTLAARGHATAIVAVTRSGRTARLLSAQRPAAPIYALTGRPEIARRMSPLWGVTPVVVPLEEDIVPVVPLASRLRAEGVLAAGATVVLVSVNPDLSRGDTNFLQLLRVD